jgi:hypothetical protein
VARVANDKNNARANMNLTSLSVDCKIQNVSVDADARRQSTETENSFMHDFSLYGQNGKNLS